MKLHRLALLTVVVCLMVGPPGIGCQDEGPWYIPGSATLPNCTDPPAFDLDGTEWYDSGVLEIQSAGCEPAIPSDMFDVCALNWVMTQEDGDVTIVVDGEYIIRGRLCADQLYLQGGWWLPVEDEGVCTYAEDSAAEVGIEQGGSVLTVEMQSGGSMLQAEGTILVSGLCDAEYEMTLTQLP